MDVVVVVNGWSLQCEEEKGRGRGQLMCGEEELGLSGKFSANGLDL